MALHSPWIVNSHPISSLPFSLPSTISLPRFSSWPLHEKRFPSLSFNSAAMSSFCLHGTLINALDKHKYPAENQMHAYSTVSMNIHTFPFILSLTFLSLPHWFLHFSRERKINCIYLKWPCYWIIQLCGHHNYKIIWRTWHEEIWSWSSW